MFGGRIGLELPIFRLEADTTEMNNVGTKQWAKPFLPVVGEIEPEGSKGMLQTLAQKVDFKIILVQGREWKQKRKLMQSSGAKSLIKGSGQEEMMSLLTGGVMYVKTLGSLAA